MYLNISKITEMIKKFELISSGNEEFNTFELKFI
jgi:hypothetical protein